MKDPEAYLDSIGVSLPCQVRRDRDAVLDVDHRERVGHEVFFFSSAEALNEFRQRPLRYIDTLTDPVTLAHFTPTEHSPVERYNDRPYYFTGEATSSAFRLDPAKYAEARLAMR